MVLARSQTRGPWDGHVATGKFEPASRVLVRGPVRDDDVPRTIREGLTAEDALQQDNALCLTPLLSMPVFWLLGFLAHADFEQASLGRYLQFVADLHFQTMTG